MRKKCNVKKMGLKLSGGEGSTVGSVKYTYYQFASAEVHKTGNGKKNLFS